MKTIVLTGASGNMGKEVLQQLSSLSDIKLRILNYKSKKFGKFVKKHYKNVSIIEGSISDAEVCKELVSGADYVINCAAVIPPKSDQNPVSAVECNYYGVKNLIDALKFCNKNTRLIHISTVALYGNRNYRHPWGRVGDPLMPSVFDPYSKTKMFGERLVLESGLPYWAVLRQTAMLHDRMLTDNVSDGLMFHTCLNSPLEWVTAKDSGVLIKNIIKKDMSGQNEDFWRRIYNIGGGAKNRNTGFDTFDDGFAIIGGSAKKFLQPSWHATRNFHGVWFSDSDVLEEKFSFQRQDCSDYWQEILKKHPYYKVAKILPPALIKNLVIVPLLNNYNSPIKWKKQQDEAKVLAYFNPDEEVVTNWDDFPLLRENHTPEGRIEYDEIKNIDNLDKYNFKLSHGFDESKDLKKLDISDMQQVAFFRGGKCLSDKMTLGDLYTPLLWECSEGHRFFATPFTVLFGGHWCEECFKNGWNYDRLCKTNNFYAQVYYDSHKTDENKEYFYKNGKACFSEVK